MADFGVSEVIALASLATSAASAGVAAYGAHEQGVAQANMANYQAAVARNNQQIAEQYAQVETARGARLEEAKRSETANREGAIRAAVGAGGLEIDSGSPLRLQEDTARLGEFDAQTIRSNAARAAYGYRVQGMSYAAQAQLDEMGAENASRSGALGAWSSVIGGAASTSDRWARFRQAGIFSGGGGP